MAASKVLESLEEEISCSLCFEKYDTDNRLPKMLPCQHTYCYLCLLQYEGSSLEKGFPCPACKKQVRIDHKGIQALPNNLATISLLERMKTLEITENTESAETKDVAAVCAPHGKQSDMFCLTCNQLLCAKCLTSMMQNKTHKNHDVLDLDSAFEKRCKELEMVKDTSQYDMAVSKWIATAKEIEDKVDDMKKEIHSKANKAIHDVQAWEQTSIEDVDKFLETNLLPTNKNIEDINFKKASVKNSLHSMKVALDERQLKSMLEVPNLIAEVNSLCSELENLSQQRPFTLTFGPVACTIRLPAPEGKYDQIRKCFRCEVRSSPVCIHLYPK